MKAMVYTEYGSADVLKFTEVARPVPKENEVLIRVMASSLNIGDRYYLTGTPLFLRTEAGMRRPKRMFLGSDVAGRVEAVGSAVTQFRPGDDVYGDLSLSGRGAFAEYVAAPEDKIAIMPANLSYEEAASMPLAGITALQAVRDCAQIRPGQKVLINGASGGVGLFVLQLAVMYGAEVTAVCSARNFDLVRQLGASHVIDYKRENFTRGSHRYDVIIAVNGYHPIMHYRRVLKPDGKYVNIGGTMTQIFQALLLGPIISKFGQKKLLSLGSAKPNQQDLDSLREIIEAGKVRPVIDRCFSLSELPNAFRYLESSHAQGKVAISMAA